ncbi:MAG: L-lactate dehydrogenase [candidate division KSB1 bacterium]|nr:L-lactate dehydrogenase [candidate division KSB1 bacterium]
MEQKLTLKICIVGAGQVGSTFAYALLIRGLALEIVLIDINRDLAEGQAQDLSHGLPYVHPTRIYAGTYADCADADIVVITAGAAQKPGESRLDLTHRNVEIFRGMIPEIAQYNRHAIFIIVSNPVDVLTYATIKFSGFAPNRVIGTGTTLDSARFRFLLSQHCGVDPRNVHAYIIGEHGDSEVPVWSLVHISGVQLDQFCKKCTRGCSMEMKQRIFEEVRTAAYHLIEKKGATYHAIGLATLTMVESIVRDQKSILTISSYLENYLGLSDVCLSVPTIVSRQGVVSQIELPLSSEELDGLHRSAQVINSVLRQVALKSG